MTLSNISHFNLSVIDKNTAHFELTTRSGDVLSIEGPMPRVKPVFDALHACFIDADDSDEDCSCGDDGTDELEEIHPEPFDLHDDAEALASAGFGTDEDYGGSIE